MQSQIEIKESVLTEVHKIKRICVMVTNVILHVSCTVAYSLFDDTGRIVKTDVLILTGDDYTNWGSNDNYIQDFILTKLGYTKLN